jgi:hypothetical protein
VSVLLEGIELNRVERVQPASERDAKWAALLGRTCLERKTSNKSR